ncbi:hypothetical protein N7533_013433 [Penicillium manginii]|uniref:uncharacterized protein n=1 Tax=Penicillium manginii TaxID=203109 RepID=UPI0025478C10|nr:uncharacterized protein N7533_013433 [Penicillium manginii]KAJ5732986.1 hypothetical protein N7533_013433 [Penicillium manginii]
MFFLGVLLSLFLLGAVAQRLDEDLRSFVTLPEVRALRFNITHVDREQVSPGYWFVAPYGQVDPEEPTTKYMQYQVGPYIYDTDGELIWAGSPVTDNRNTFDFRANWNIDGDPHLSFIVQHEYDRDADKGRGVIMGNDYELEREVGAADDLNAFDMHEFKILDGGKTALACTTKPQQINLADFDRPEEESWVVVGGFVEIDIENSEILFEWDSYDKLSLTESVKFIADDEVLNEPGWDYVHINSVDKNSDGDYIISMRFTNTIYLVSGKDGEIMWRLGGKESDFEQDFSFTRQHDVKFVKTNNTHHVISFMNNAADELHTEGEITSALFVELDISSSPMTATVMNRMNHPDGNFTRFGGNIQQLSNGNIFVGWNEKGYMSEYGPDGDLIMSARFSSDRYASYRSYKFDWIGQPTTPPDLATSVYGADDQEMITVMHVSWNGATDVARWEFYARSYEHGRDVLIATTNKTSFETMYMTEGYMDWVTAKAIDENGNVLGISEVCRSEVPDWEAVGFAGQSSHPKADDPEILQNIREKLDSGEYGDLYDDNTTDEDRKAAVHSATTEVAESVYKAYGMIQMLENITIGVLTMFCIGGILAGVWYVRCRKMRSYQHLPTDEASIGEDASKAD